MTFRGVIMALFCLFFVSIKAQNPKYIFYFIGDGMGFNHIETALFYQTPDIRNMKSNLTFTEFPVAGQVSTYSASHYITDSSAAGTALASGEKTNNNVVGEDTLGRPLTSIIIKAKDNGWLTGVISSASIDDATPAAFYAHESGRSMYYKIGTDAANSGITFFGGAGFKTPDNKKNPADPNLYKLLESKGYYIQKGITNNAPVATTKKVMIPEKINSNFILPLAIDRKIGDMALADFTSEAIRFLYRPEQKFIMMIEGGLIDKTAHAHDAGAVVHEVTDLADNVKLAYDFYLQHPDETLIIVTADHETGGLALGTTYTNLYIQLLKNQKVSLSILSSSIKKMRKESTNKATWENISELLRENLGFGETIKLTPQEEQSLKDCFNQTFINKDVKDVESLYSKDDSLAVLAIEILAAHCEVGWTTKSHSAAPVPVYAIGTGSDFFKGRIDNTDIPKILQQLMQLP